MSTEQPINIGIVADNDSDTNSDPSLSTNFPITSSNDFLQTSSFNVPSTSPDEKQSSEMDPSLYTSLAQKGVKFYNNVHEMKKKEEDWSGANLETLCKWIQTSSLQIATLDIAIQYYRSIVRRNVLLGLVFSTASGSLSLSQMNSTQQQFAYNVIFTILSFSTAIFTGLIKIYQIQERLEEFIQLKQEWIGFSLPITTEIQLPVKERKSALDLINKHKNKYLDLLKRDADIPNSIKGQAYKRLYHNKEDYIKNIAKYKKLKEVFSCTDVNYFIKAADELDEDEDKFFYKVDELIRWHNCICIGMTNGYNYLAELYKFFMTNKDKYADENTGLSNIILTVITEEDNEQRTKKMSELLNKIRERRYQLNSYIKNKHDSESGKRRTELDISV
jgi:hypothetical protein